ncbi:hypothetical protein PR202_ga21536 [Eleusine coracana subsp. coracana]|uniref:LOB domain-containing protein n=1 Tax=Eleusine coracana subsp. coracana TaxID=191504 RepID=A0AAV5D1N9_ELECO|nr:hypothetical protein QOZ80_8AG0637710 [Eleusine coracana subsp. coracana]GJN04027.1 hypothetical protein PR202_ga21536 [Eleusine coracana subsp. coracana]
MSSGVGSGSSNNTEVELGSSRRCAACKYLRRRCDPGGCVLAPYFPASRPRRYADVHAVFGTSNVTRLLQGLPVQERGRAADAMAAEAQWRVRDPVYGSAGIIDRLQQQISAAQRDLATTRAELAMARPVAGAQPPPPLMTLPPPPPPASVHVCNAGHLLAVQAPRDEAEEEEPLMDPDVFLDLDDL